MLQSISEFDLVEIKNIQSEEKFNFFAQDISRKIAASFIRNHYRIDYDLQELFIIKLYKRNLELINELIILAEGKVKRDFKCFRNQFTSWVFMAIQDLGESALAEEYESKLKLNSKISIQLRG